MWLNFYAIWVHDMKSVCIFVILNVFPYFKITIFRLMSNGYILYILRILAITFVFLSKIAV